jgi:hypothetical protein
MEELTVAKRKTKADETKEIFLEHMAQLGNVRCPLCSNENWDVFHTERQVCPNGFVPDTAAEPKR